MRYLIWTRDHLGDIVMDLAIFNAMARLDAQSHIEVYAKPPHHVLLEETSIIDKVHVRPSKTGEYLVMQAGLLNQRWDVFISTRYKHPISCNLFFTLCRAKYKRFVQYQPRYEPPSEVLTRLSMLDGILPSWDKQVEPFIYVKDDLVQEVYAKLGLSYNDRFLTIAPGASIPEKIWSKDNYVELINLLHDKYDDVLIMGSDGEIELCTYIAKKSGSRNIAGQLGTLETCALLSKSSLHLSNDSGSAHVAAGVRTKCLSIGSIVHNYRWRPWGQHQLLGLVADIKVSDVIAELGKL